MTMVIGSAVSWFLYLASVSDKLSGIAGFFGVLLSFVCIIGTAIVCGVKIFAISTNDKEDAATAEVAFKPLLHMYKWFIAGGIICGLIYSVMPAKETLYAIAAAEVGEKIVTSEKVQGVADDATKALQAWLRKQIEQNSPKDKKSD